MHGKSILIWLDSSKEKESHRTKAGVSGVSECSAAVVDVSSISSGEVLGVALVAELMEGAVAVVDGLLALSSTTPGFAFWACLLSELALSPEFGVSWSSSTNSILPLGVLSKHPMRHSWNGHTSFLAT